MKHAKPLIASALFAVVLSSATCAQQTDRTAGIQAAFSQVSQLLLRMEASRGLHLSYHNPQAARDIGYGTASPNMDAGVMAFAMVGPVQIAPYLGMEEQGGWPSRLGFTPSDLNDIVTINTGSERAHVMTLATGIGDVAQQTLLGNGYIEVSGPYGTYLQRGGDQDFNLDLSRRDVRDPFGGELGQASRVAINDDRLVYTNATPLLPELIFEEAVSLTDSPAIASLLSAIDDVPLGKAQLLQATVMSDPFMFMPSPLNNGVILGGQVAPPQDIPVLGPWTVGIMAELSDGENDTGLIALAFVSEDTAEQAAAALPETWANHIAQNNGEPAASLFTDPINIAQSPNEPSVLVLHFTSTTDPDASEFRRLTNFQRLYRMVINADLSILRPM